MIDVEARARMLLRAEIRSCKETIVASARDVTTRGLFVVTDWLPPEGTDVVLSLSFPSLIEPIEVRARVVEQRHAMGVGEQGGVVLEFAFDSEAARARVAEVVDVLAARRRAAEKPSVRTYRVLLVEDNAFIRDMFAYGISRFFQQRKTTLELEHVGDAASAWQALDNAFDLVIVDYYLPAEDGASLIARLRRDPRFAKLPIVAISVGGRDAREATLSAGADLFLDKPIVLRDLLETLQLLSAGGGNA